MQTAGWSRREQFACLFCLAMVNSSLILCMRASRTTRQPLYNPASVVVVGEVLKFATTLTLEVFDKRASPLTILSCLAKDISSHPTFILKLTLPSVLYAFQNNLCFVALSNLPAVKYQILYQLKILTTALFSVLLLSKHISGRQWLALAMLVAGVVTVQYTNERDGAAAGNPMVGLLAIMVASLSSGFAGVYFERLSKAFSLDRSLWLQSMELSILGSFFSLFIYLINTDGQSTRHPSFFENWNGMTVAILVLQTVSGVLVALVIRHTDNILKGFATSASIVISSFGTFVWMGEVPTTRICGGAAAVMMAARIYAVEELCCGNDPWDR